MWKDIQSGLQTLAALDAGQIAVALAMGIRLDKHENGITLPLKVADAEKTSASQTLTPMQSALLETLGLSLHQSLSREMAAQQIVFWYQDNQSEFFTKLSPAFQTQYCGGRIDRFECLTNQLLSTNAVAKGCAIWCGIAAVSVFAIWIACRSIFG